ncbi:MAG TPA: hypothetical protein VIY72_09790 [Acidimicrobiales bacterium]
MGQKPLRVVVWGTGGIGSIAIPAIQRRPGLELVGVWVHSEAKVGQDAGELANGEPIGLAATNDADALMALEPDCIVYCANARDSVAVAEYDRFLRAGINVVSTSAIGAIYPPVYRPRSRDKVVAAAEAGSTTFYASGIEPGFAADHLPALLTTQSISVTSVHSYEIGLYDDYPVAATMMDGMGFNRPLDFESGFTQPGAILHSWAGQVHFMADLLEVELDDVREEYLRVATPRDLHVACGTIEAGTCGALRIQVIGVVDGRDAIILDHVTRMAADLAPEWPSGPHDVTYRVEITGDPNIYCDMGFTTDDAAKLGIMGMDAGAGAMVATCMRVVNAIPYVVEARPGLLSSLDLPMTVPKGAFGV